MTGTLSTARSLHGIKTNDSERFKATWRAELEKTSSKGLDFVAVNQIRRCSRPTCVRPAVATLTYAYAQSTAYIGPLSEKPNPHAWDLCDPHATSITAPVGWDLLRVEAEDTDEDDLTALAEAVREQGRIHSGLLGQPQLNGNPESEIAPNHPAKRHAKQAAQKATRRAHLSIVPNKTTD